MHVSTDSRHPDAVSQPQIPEDDEHDRSIHLQSESAIWLTGDCHRFRMTIGERTTLWWGTAGPCCPSTSVFCLPFPLWPKSSWQLGRNVRVFYCRRVIYQMTLFSMRLSSLFIICLISTMLLVAANKSRLQFLNLYSRYVLQQFSYHRQADIVHKAANATRSQIAVLLWSCRADSKGSGKTVRKNEQTYRWSGDSHITTIEWSRLSPSVPGTESPNQIEDKYRSFLQKVITSLSGCVFFGEKINYHRLSRKSTISVDTSEQLSFFVS